MSLNNRKYIQSTGSLLARLNEESNSNPNNIYLNSSVMPNKQMQNQPTQYNNYNRGQANQYQQQQNGTYTSMPQYSTAQVTHQHNMFGNGFNPNNQNPIYGQSQQLPQQAVTSASQLFNQLNNQGKLILLYIII